MRFFAVMTGAALLGLVLGLAGDAQERVPQGEAQGDDGVEVQTRGPVHEAFAQPMSRDPEPGALLRKQPPEPVPELPPDMKPEGETSVWIPGYWAWDEDRDDYLWVSGTWRVPPPGRNWMPGYFDDDDGGWRWVAGFWAVQGDTEVELYPEPPAPIQEAIPPQVEVDTTYVAGNWVYRTDRYWWRPGYYVRPRAGWVWVNPCYNWTPAGYVYLDGYWDHDIHRRGLLFSPVYFDRAVWQRPGFVYRPHYAVHTDFLFGSLFVHTARRHYFYGDYYEPRYVSRGFHPWVSFRYGGGRYYDPLFAHYRWHNRDRDGWEDRLRDGYDGRRDGSIARPPRTLREQQVQTAKAGGADVRVAVPIQQFTKIQNNITLQQVTKVEQQQHQKTGQQIQKTGQVRAQAEAKGKVQGKAGLQQPVKIAVPRVQMSAKAGTTKQQEAPPPPPIPKAVERKPMAGQPKVRDVDPPTGVEPKGKNLPPKGKEVTPKGKDVDPLPKPKGVPPKGQDVDPLPKPKAKGKDVDPLPKPKAVPPKAKDVDPLPKPKVNPPKERDFDPPAKQKVNPPKERDVDPPAKPKAAPPKGKDFDSPSRPKQDDDVKPVRPIVPPAAKPRDVPESRDVPSPRDVPEVRPTPAPAPRPEPRPPEKRDKGKDRDR